MTAVTALIVIPCLNEERMLPGLLADLVAEGACGRIVVADGGSSDRSREIVLALAAQHPNIVLLDNPARLQSAGVNLAARRFGALCEWLVRIDAHCCYPRGYVRGLLAVAVERQCHSVVVPMITHGEAGFQRAVAAVQNSVLGTGGSPHRHVTEGRFVEHGHHAAMRMDLFCAVGGYDETFSHNEDAELDQRLLAAGAQIWLEPRLAIVYFPRCTIRALFRQYRGYGAGRARTTRRHRTRIPLRQMIPLAIAPLIALAAIGMLGAFVSLWFMLLALPAVGWLLACLAGGGALALRQRSWPVLASGVAAATMHAGWSLGNWQTRLSRAAPGRPPERIPIAGAPVQQAASNDTETFHRHGCDQ